MKVNFVFVFVFLLIESVGVYFKVASPLEKGATIGCCNLYDCHKNVERS